MQLQIIFANVDPTFKHLPVIFICTSK